MPARIANGGCAAASVVLGEHDEIIADGNIICGNVDYCGTAAGIARTGTRTDYTGVSKRPAGRPTARSKQLKFISDWKPDFRDTLVRVHRNHPVIGRVEINNPVVACQCVVGTQTQLRNLRPREKLGDVRTTADDKSVAGSKN